MKRRNFVLGSLAMGTISATAAGTSLLHLEKSPKDLIEIRTYEISFGGNQAQLIDFLRNVLNKAMKDKGLGELFLFKEFGDSEPVKLYAILRYPNMESFLRVQQVDSDKEYLSMSEPYDAISPQNKIYNRISSSLLLGFDGMPHMKTENLNNGIFELRTYEGYSENAVKRKIEMFNKEELALFLKIGLNPVFFGEMLIGPNKPCMVYMLQFENMDSLNTAWNTFGNHPEWKTMSAKPEYANSVSNIRKILLTAV